MPPINAIIFDFAGVLVDWSIYRPFDGILTKEQADAFFERTDFMTFNHRQDAGRSWADARIEFEAKHPDDVSYLDIYLKNFDQSTVGPVEGMPDIFQELTSTGIDLFGLSNWSRETVDTPKNKVGLISELKEFIVSGDVGLAKPDPRIFALAIQHFGVDPSATLFVDDMERNIVAAAQMGLRTHLFVNAETFHEALVGLGALSHEGGVR